MHDSIAIPACFSFGNEKLNEDHHQITASSIKSGQSVVMSIYQTELAGHSRLITITWCKNLLLHGLSISVQRLEEDEDQEQYQCCKVELKPWYFWRKHGSKHFEVDGKVVNVVWDLKAAKFNGEPCPQSDFYIAISCGEEVVLLVGDLKKDAFRRTGCRPALVDPTLISKKEHVFGKKRFSTRIQFDHEKGKFFTISIEFVNSNNNGVDPELEMRIEGELAIHIKHLQWKFRGNEDVFVEGNRLQVYWDVHDWLFGEGFKHGLFIFKPIMIQEKMVSSSMKDEEEEDIDDLRGASTQFSCFLHAWKIE